MSLRVDTLAVERLEEESPKRTPQVEEGPSSLTEEKVQGKLWRSIPALAAQESLDQPSLDANCWTFIHHHLMSWWLGSQPIRHGCLREAAMAATHTEQSARSKGRHCVMQGA